MFYVIIVMNMDSVHTHLPSDVSYKIWNIKIFRLTVLGPGCEVPQLSVISVIC